jgi:hypothetical protein
MIVGVFMCVLFFAYVLYLLVRLFAFIFYGL